MQAAGKVENQLSRQQQAVNRLLALDGVTDEDGHLVWPVGLRILPGDRAARLRDQVDALLTQERDGVAAGTVPAGLHRELLSAMDGLRKQLRRDREERFSLTHRAYDDAENYLVKLKRAAKQLVEVGEAAARQAAPDKPAGKAPPRAAESR
jgi:hypothetical protein